VEKYCSVGQATDDNMEHAHWMLDTHVYKHTRRMCNTCCFFIAIIHERASMLLSNWNPKIDGGVNKSANMATGDVRDNKNVYFSDKFGT
jgi:hypothetical protein